MTIETKPITEALWLGEVDYEIALESQMEQVARHKADPNTADKLFLLEHPPTYTYGIRGKEEHLLIDSDQLAAEGISTHRIKRGGDITYHGPGQLVGYPILNLKRLYHERGFPKLKLHGYVRELEEVIIQAIAQFGIQGWRYPGYTGVWVGSEEHPRKIAAIGIHVTSKGISSHGFALNVNPNMNHFSYIIPCGIREHAATSLSQEVLRSSHELDREITTADLHQPIIDAFQRVLEVEVIQSF